METIFHFDEKKDFQETIPGLSVSIRDALTTLVVNPTMGVEGVYTKETEVDKVGHYLRDQFDVAMAYKANNLSINAAPTVQEYTSPTE